MTQEELNQLQIKVNNDYDIAYPRYINIINRLFPEKLKTPYERFLYDNKDASLEDIDIDILWEIEREEYENYSYINPIEIMNLFYDYIYTNKPGLNKEEQQFIKYFDHILRVRNQLKNPMQSDLYNTQILTFNNETIIITDPAYVFSKDWDKNWTNLLNKYIYHSTLIGDVVSTFYNTKMQPNFQWNNPTYKKLGTCTADAGLIGVFPLNDVLEYNNKDFNQRYLNTKLVMQIDNFSGTVQIKTIFDIISYDIFFYVEGIGNIDFIGYATSF